MGETDEEMPDYEPAPVRVDLERLRRLRGIGARENSDLIPWYESHD